MANREHVKIVKQGAQAIRKWRKKNPDTDFDLSRANLRKANLANCDLSDANLAKADLTGADLTNANLSQAWLVETDLSGTRMCRANLRGAMLLGSYIRAVEIDEADFSRSICGLTTFAGVDLSETNGLDNLLHSGPCSIGVDTLFRSKGRIPQKFLRDCGVPEVLIQYLPSLMQDPVQFYSCFISFNEADDVFSERLYNDLQAKGVRCWRWKEDARWGRELWGEVDSAVRLYDKLIVICSEQSLKAPAVLREIERALQKEDELKRQGRPAEVLFPVRLDDYVFGSWQHPRKADATAKYVGDFRNWKDPKAYKQALERLIRDLRAEFEQEH